MAINETIVTGRKFRRLIDKDSKLWQRISWWTKAGDVEFNDGKTAEQKLGNINGITSDFSVNNDSMAASSSLSHRAHTRFMEFTDNGRIISIKIGEDGSPYIEYKDGADTVLKKLGDVEISDKTVVKVKPSECKVEKNNWRSFYIKLSEDDIKEDYKFYILSITSAGGFYVAASGVQAIETGEGAFLIQSANATGTSSDTAAGGSGQYAANTCNIQVRNYIIPPQKAGTKLGAKVKGVYAISLIGVK